MSDSSEVELLVVRGSIKTASNLNVNISLKVNECLYLGDQWEQEEKEKNKQDC